MLQDRIHSVVHRIDFVVLTGTLDVASVLRPLPVDVHVSFSRMLAVVLAITTIALRYNDHFDRVQDDGLAILKMGRELEGI